MNKLKVVILTFSILLFGLNIINPYIYAFDKKYEHEGVAKIYLTGNIENMNDKSDEREVGFNFLSEKVSFIKYAKIKIQGSSSIRYEKKNYTIKLYNDANFDSKYDVDLGWGEENKYVLKANWIDKSHSRNIVSARIVSSASKKYGLFESAPNNGNIDGFPVEVYINGEFLGLYTFNMPKDAWMLGLDSELGHLAFDADINSDQTFFKKKFSYSDWGLEVGEETDENLEKFNDLYSFVKNSSDKEFKKNFSKHLNLDAVLNYYVLSEVFLFADNVGKNMIMISYDGEVWYPVLYDLDTSFGASVYGEFVYSSDSMINFKKSLLWSRFEKLYWNEIVERYKELRKDIIVLDDIYSTIDDFYYSIPHTSFEKENNRWKDIPGFEVDQMKMYITERVEFLDKYFVN